VLILLNYIVVSIMQIAVCDGTVTESGGVISCSGSWVVAHYPIISAFDPALISPVVAVEAFGSGLIACGVPILVAHLGRHIIAQIPTRR
jgi:hypothetical protein